MSEVHEKMRVETLRSTRRDASPSAIAFVDMHDRLHRAVLLFRGGLDNLEASSYWPEQEGFDPGDYSRGEINIPAEFVRVIEAWGRQVARPGPGEIDRAFHDILLLNPATKLERQILTLRAWQCFGRKESWRRIGAVCRVSYEYARRTHRDLVLRAMVKEAQQNAAQKHERLVARNRGLLR